MACRTGCPTPGAHETWGDCARSAAIQIDRYSLTQDGQPAEKRKHETLARYRDLRKAGIQPKAPTLSAVEQAEKVAA